MPDDQRIDLLRDMNISIKFVSFNYDIWKVKGDYGDSTSKAEAQKLKEKKDEIEKKL